MNSQEKSRTNLILNGDGSVYHLNLRPEHISDTLITVGDPDRVEQVAKYFDQREFSQKKREFITVTGTYKGRRLTVISTGMGPDNIEIFCNEIDALVNYDLENRVPLKQKKSLNIIRIGTSGAIQKDVEVGSFLLSHYAAGLDNLLHFYHLTLNRDERELSEEISRKVGLPSHPYVVACDGELLKIFREEFAVGNTVTCPGFYAPQGRNLRMHSKYEGIIEDLSAVRCGDFQISNLEMETSAYYAFSRILGHRAISLNAVLANRITDAFSNDPEEVIDRLIRKALDAIFQAGL